MFTHNAQISRKKKSFSFFKPFECLKVFSNEVNALLRRGIWPYSNSVPFSKLLFFNIQVASLLVPLNCKRKSSVVQNHANLDGSWLMDQVCFHLPWSAHTSTSLFTMHTTPRSSRYPQRWSCQQKLMSCLENKRLSYMFFPCNTWIQSLWTFFLHRKSIAHNLNWPEASAITYLGCMPRFISWYCPVTDVLIVRSFWVCPPSLLFLNIL